MAIESGSTCDLFTGGRGGLNAGAGMGIGAGAGVVLGDGLLEGGGGPLDCDLAERVNMESVPRLFTVRYRSPGYGSRDSRRTTDAVPATVCVSISQTKSSAN